MKSAVVIPARMAATRLPGKPLLAETGKPLIGHVWETACRATRVERVVVATDDERIAKAVLAFGGQAQMTSSSHQSGTERVAEVAGRLPPDWQIIVNLQGDEPEIEPAAIDQTIALLEDDRTASVATLAAPIHDRERFEDPACVKVVFDHEGIALYFSRSPVPYRRSGFGVRDSGFAEDAGEERPTVWGYQHIGLYAYRRSTLLDLAQLPESPLEQAEKLEQLRWMEAGLRIKVSLICEAVKGIDTPADYAAFVERYRRRYTGSVDSFTDPSRDAGIAAPMAPNQRVIE